MQEDWKDILAAKTGYEPAHPQHDDVPEHQPDSSGLGLQNKIKIQLDRKQRAGKTVTLIFDIEGSETAVKQLAGQLKAKCGAGGSARGNEILIQGDVRKKCLEFFESKGWKAKII